MKASDQASACGAGERWRFEYASPSNSEPDGADAGDAAEITATREVSVRAKTPSHYIMFDMAADEA